MTKQREAFEAWALDEGVSLVRDANGYASEVAHLAWIAWQIATAQTLTDPVTLCARCKRGDRTLYCGECAEHLFAPYEDPDD